jgi:predicted TIM-barrel fold metal-dependent hydrolase
VGHDRLLLGTDLPFPPGDPDPLASLRNAGFDDSQVRQIVETGPLKLFGIS